MVCPLMESHLRLSLKSGLRVHLHLTHLPIPNSCKPLNHNSKTAIQIQLELGTLQSPDILVLYCGIEI
jgi:hypothetical protein